MPSITRMCAVVCCFAHKAESYSVSSRSEGRRSRTPGSICCNVRPSSFVYISVLFIFLVFLNSCSVVVLFL